MTIDAHPTPGPFGDGAPHPPADAPSLASRRGSAIHRASGAAEPLRAASASLPLGFGVSGPFGGRLLGDDEARALIHQALDGGIRVFDTAPFYGPLAERRLGAALAAHPAGSDALVATKVGTFWRWGRPYKDFSRDGMRRSLDTSLARLGRTRLDAVFLHGAPPDALSDQLLGDIAAWREQGLVRLLGACGRGAELDPAIASGVFDVIMAPVRLGLSGEAAAQRTRAREAGVAIVGIETLRPALDPWRAPRRVSDLWRLARTVVRRPARHVGAPASIEACLAFALSEADLAVTTTTRPAHLAALLQLARAQPAA